MRGKSFARLRRRRGAVLVEFALGGATFLALLVAAFGLNYGVFVKATLRHAAQQGARFATTGRVLDRMSHEDSVRAVVMQNSFGLLTRDNSEVGVYYLAADGHSEAPARSAAVVEVTVSHALNGVGTGQRVEVKALETMLDGGRVRR